MLSIDNFTKVKRWMDSAASLILIIALSLLISGCEAFTKFGALAVVDMTETGIEIVKSTDERRQRP